MKFSNCRGCRIYICICCICMNMLNHGNHFHMWRAHHFSKKFAGSTQSKQWRIFYLFIELLYRYKRAETSRITVLNIRKLYLYFVYFKRIIFSMLCNMRSKLIPTDHIYIHKYRNVLSFDTFLNPHMYLKSLLIV